MLQKSQWTMAAALAIGALLVVGSRPAEAQVRLRLTSPVTSPIKTGIVIPAGTPQQSGIIVPPSNPTPPATKPPVVNTTTPVVNTPAPVVNTPAPVVKTTAPVVRTTAPVVTPPIQSGNQGFSIGPGVLGVPRVPLGRVVNRVGPDINGDGWSDIRKDPRSK
jgi:hypothetical protein